MSVTDLGPMVISKAGYAALMRVLLEQDDLRITNIDSEPVAVGGPSHNRFYRVRLTAVGEEGESRLSVLLKIFPEQTWMEAWNPALDGPAEIVTLENDLLSVLPDGMVDPTIASARAREGKPAWTMARDVIANLGQASGLGEMDSSDLKLVLLRLAEWHALHWDAQAVLDYVYPWVTRQAEWLRAAAGLYTSALAGQLPASPIGQLIQAEHPDATAALVALFAALAPADVDSLRRLLAAPDALIDRLTAAPLTVAHGAPTVGHMALEEGRLVLVEWEMLQVGSSSGDVWAFLASLPDPALSVDEAITFYLHALENIVGPIDRVGWHAAYEVAPVAAFLLTDLGQAARATPPHAPSPGLIARATEVARLARDTGLVG